MASTIHELDVIYTKWFQIDRLVGHLVVESRWGELGSWLDNELV